MEATTMIEQARRTAACAVAILVLAATAACGGGEKSSAEKDPPVVIPEETAVPYEGYESVDGLLVSADLSRVVLASPGRGQIVFRVRQENLPTIGLEHLQSHAGFTDIGFRVYYEQQGRRRYIIGAEEIPPPTGSEEEQR
jgi:hypothetical protein